MIVKDINGCFFNEEKITEEKYNEILSMLRNPPEAPKGYACRLNSNLEWELCEAPIIEGTDPELTEGEALNILLGGDVE